MEKGKDLYDIPIDSFTIYEEDLVSLAFVKVNEDKYRFCRNDLKEMFQIFINEITEQVYNNNKVQIKDFISIKSYLPKKSQATHPLTGETVIKGENRRIKVVPIGDFKRKLKGN